MARTLVYRLFFNGNDHKVIVFLSVAAVVVKCTQTLRALKRVVFALNSIEQIDTQYSDRRYTWFIYQVAAIVFFFFTKIFKKKVKVF